MVGRCVPRIEVDSAPELAFGIGPVPIKPAQDEAHGGVSFGAALVNLDGAQGRGAAIGDSGGGFSNTQPSQQNIGIREPSIGFGIIWISSDGALEHVSALLEAVGCSLVQERTSLTVEL